MNKVFNILAYVGLAVLLAGLGYVAGRRSARVVCANSALTTTDTLWVEVHDTCWRVESAEVIRTDTVRLAYVPDFTVSGTLGETNVHENGISGTYQDRYGYENGISGTHTDTLVVHDSVFVEVPIVSHTFVGDHWRVTAHGYRVGLDEVWFDRQVVKTVTTNTRYASKRWNFNVGVQMGYGYTMHGGSPYVGLGVAFGYTF